MKIKIKLDARKNSYSETSGGFPIVLSVAHGAKRKVLRTGYFAEVKQWDNENALPKKAHPKFIDILNYLNGKKLIIAQVEYQSTVLDLTINEVLKVILNIDSDVFYSEAAKQVSNTKDIKLCALNSFNKYFPDYTFTQITANVAKEYLLLLMNEPTPSGKPRTASGVHTYLRKLTTLWNQCEKANNPFKGVRPKLQATAQKQLSDTDIIKLKNTTFKLVRYDSRNTDESTNLNRYYWLLMFYLGGVNFNVLSELRHDRDVRDGRVNFNRNKGGSNTFCSNKLFPEAVAILDKIQAISNCYPYFTPIHKNKDYKSARARFNKGLKKQCEPLELTSDPSTYSARYSFINRAKQLVIDERICMEIVGHTQKTTNSIYADNFAYHIRDAAHEQIINL